MIIRDLPQEIIDILKKDAAERHAMVVRMTGEQRKKLSDQEWFKAGFDHGLKALLAQIPVSPFKTEDKPKTGESVATDYFSC